MYVFIPRWDAGKHSQLSDYKNGTKSYLMCFVALWEFAFPSE